MLHCKKEEQVQGRVHEKYQLCERKDGRTPSPRSLITKCSLILQGVHHVIPDSLFFPKFSFSRSFLLLFFTLPRNPSLLQDPHLKQTLPSRLPGWKPPTCFNSAIHLPPSLLQYKSYLFLSTHSVHSSPVCHI